MLPTWTLKSTSTMHSNGLPGEFQWRIASEPCVMLKIFWSQIYEWLQLTSSDMLGSLRGDWKLDERYSKYWPTTQRWHCSHRQFIWWMVVHVVVEIVSRCTGLEQNFNVFWNIFFTLTLSPTMLSDVACFNTSRWEKTHKRGRSRLLGNRTTLLLPQKLELPLLPPVTTLPPLPPLTTLPPLPPLTTLPPLQPVTTLPPLPPLTTLPPLPPLTTLPPLSPVTTLPPLSPVTTMPPLSPVTTLPPLSPVTTLLPFFRDWLNINQKNYNYFENAKVKTAEWNSENFEVPSQLKTDHSSESQFKVLKNCINLLKLF